MKRKEYPDFHKSLSDLNAYPAATRKIKFAETHKSFFYKTGADVYKLRKPSPLYSNLAIKEAFTHEAQTLGRRWAPTLQFEVLALCRADDGRYLLGSEGEPVDYALRVTQLSAHHWLDYIIANGKLSSAIVARVARFLAGKHLEFPAAPELSEKRGRPEHFRELCDEIAYQSKKYVHSTVSEPILELVTRNIARFLDEQRKLFLRRIKKGRIVDGHGAFVPEHIHLRGKEVAALGVLDGQAKYRILDAANDVASLLNELHRLGLDVESALFIKRYTNAAKDRELEKMLPVYRTFQAMRMGLTLSERIAEKHDDDETLAQLTETAQGYYSQAAQYARLIPREA